MHRRGSPASASEELRLARALARESASTRDSVLARMRAQLPDEARNAACNEVVVNDRSVEEPTKKADALAARLSRSASSKDGHDAAPNHEKRN